MEKPFLAISINNKSTEKMSSRDEKNIEKAKTLITAAENKLKSRSIFEVLFGSSSNRMEKAQECLEQAGNLFKLSKLYDQAGDAFFKAANIQAISRFDAATNYIQAANCYKKYDPPKAVDCLLKAVEIYVDAGKFLMAASSHEKIAVIYETSINNPAALIQHYEQAADYYRGEESDTSANRCLIKAAHCYSFDLEDYEKAVEIYEEVAFSEMKSTLLKYNVKAHFFRAGLCHLIIDANSARNAAQHYIELFPAFSDTREFKFLNNLITCVEECDIDKYTDEVATYDSVSRLDHWHVTILLKIKNKINDQPDIC